MSTNSAEAPPQEIVASESSLDDTRPAVVILAPIVAALVALLVHQFVPDGQRLLPTWTDTLPIWLHPYPLLLEVMLALAVALAAAQAVDQSLRPWVRYHAPLMAGAIGVLVAWDLITQKLAWMPLPYFPGPNLVFASIVEDRRILFECAWRSLLLLLSGYGAGVVVGVASGVLIGWFAPARYWGMPVLKIVGPLPATALVPLVMMLSDQAFVAATALIAFAVWFPVTMLTASGIANVRLSFLDVARTLGAGQWYLIRHVAIPSALPNIFVGLFMGLGAAFLTMIVAETIGVEAGLGWYLKWKQGYMAYAPMYGSILIMMVFFSGLMTLLFFVRDRVLIWQKGVIKW